MNEQRAYVTVSPTDEQLLAAVRLGAAMWAESPVYGHMDKDVDKMIEFASSARTDPETFFNVAVDGSGRVSGFFIGGIAPHGFHSSSFAFDRLMYVAPDRRGGVAAVALINAFEQWAREHGADTVMLGTTTGVHAEQTERFYNRLGYSTVGAVTMKEVH